MTHPALSFSKGFRLMDFSSGYILLNEVIANELMAFYKVMNKYSIPIK